MAFIPLPSPGNTTRQLSQPCLPLKLRQKISQSAKRLLGQQNRVRSVKHILVLVDESIRADFIDLQPGNTTTPNLGKLSNQLINFGPAVSGGVCSNYSNALMRFGASRKDLTNSVNSNATIFAYAKKAGYRTVYIDAQAYNNSRGHKIQNFMNLREKGED